LFPLNGMRAEALPRDHELIKESINKSIMFNPHAPSLRIWHQHDMSMSVGRGFRCGFPIFELNKFTEQEVHHLKSLDVIFVASNWAKSVCIDNGLDAKKVFIAPLGVDREIFKPMIVNNPIASMTATKFFTCGKWEIRKGHGLLLEAFNQAFEPDDDVHLILNCINPFIGDTGNAEWAEAFKTSKLADKISVIGPRLNTQIEVAVLMNSCDCGVFPSLAEGWNLELLETMSCGKHVIATDYSGHTQYINWQNANPIKITELEDAYDGIWFNGQGQWAKFESAQMEQLVNSMRAIHKMKQSKLLTPNTAGIETAEKFSWANTAKAIVNVVDDLRPEYNLNELRRVKNG
jgi:glycosyltransferase involved in cell wall biosynthesis